ncbi:MAG: hypothetical protein R3293_21080 [Candidatus Promineifilaceae bacterium]|nr:hypothetical protein [Candidatus Promineifilaceae bacterium]
MVRIAIGLLGTMLAAYTFYSALLTFVVPRSASNVLTAIVFKSVRFIFDLIAGQLGSYEQRDRLMAVYAPLSLLLLVPFWLLLIAVGFSMIYWALGITPYREAFIASGSSLLTLGYTTFDHFAFHLFSFTEAVTGLVLVAMLIAYLPTMYSAFSQRETAVSMLEVRAGWPPTAPELLWRSFAMDAVADMDRRFWESWEEWFTQIDESHTSLAALVFFRSPRPNQSWVVAAGVVLDAAALQVCVVDEEVQVHPALVIRAGILALRHVADFFKVDYNPDPHFPQDPISVTREDFDAAYQRLREQGVPVKKDRELAWKNFAGWRVNYDSVLNALARLTMAPEVPWLSEYTFAPPDQESGETAGQLRKAG